MRESERPAAAAAAHPRPPPTDARPRPRPRPRRPRRRRLALADALLAAGVVAPAVVGYWRGTWCLMDASVGWAPSMAVGLAGHLVFMLGQHRLAAAAAWLAAAPEAGAGAGAGAGARPGAAPSACRRVALLLASRLYTAVYGFCCVNAWRGPWKLLDVYAGTEARGVLATGSVALAALAATRTLRNVAAPPCAVATDSAAGYFRVPTMFRVSSSRSVCLYALDCLFSVLVVGNLVVFVWRGVWVLFDIYLYPDNFVSSSLASLVLGYGVVGVTFALQPVLRRVCARLQGLWRLLVADLYLFLSFVGTVNVWRGFWNVLNVYFLPEHELLSYWVTHVGCLLLLMLLNCSNSILVRGVFIDAEEDDGKCVVFPTHYLRLFAKMDEQRDAESQQLERMLGPGEGAAPVVVPAGSLGARAPPHDAPARPSNHLALTSLLNASKSAQAV